MVQGSPAVQSTGVCTHLPVQLLKESTVQALSSLQSGSEAMRAVDAPLGLQVGLQTPEPSQHPGMHGWLATMQGVPGGLGANRQRPLVTSHVDPWKQSILRGVQSLSAMHSIWQSAEQPSPPTVFPSSHCSPHAKSGVPPSPQTHK